MVVCAPYECWEANPVTLQEQQMILAVEPFLPYKVSVLIMCFIKKIEIR